MRDLMYLKTSLFCFAIVIMGFVIMYLLGKCKDLIDVKQWEHRYSTTEEEQKKYSIKCGILLICFMIVALFCIVFALFGTNFLGEYIFPNGYSYLEPQKTIAIEDIKTEHTICKNEIGKIKSIDKYTLAGETNYDKVDIRFENCNKTIGLCNLNSEEYENLIGEGNDAVESDVYTLEYNEEILRYKGMRNPIENLINTDESVFTLDYSQELERSNYCDNVFKVFSCGTRLSVDFQINRFSCFGENDFSDEEIEYYQTLIQEKVAEIYKTCWVME